MVAPTNTTAKPNNAVPSMFAHRHRSYVQDAQAQADAQQYGIMDAYVSGRYMGWMMEIRAQKAEMENRSVLQSSSSFPIPPPPAKQKPFFYPSISDPPALHDTMSATLDKVNTEITKPLAPEAVPKLQQHVSVIVFGASGDLAKKKTYPALFSLYKHLYLPRTTNILGYARSHVELSDFHSRIQAHLKDTNGELVQKFLHQCHYLHGSYDQDKDYIALNDTLTALEAQMGAQVIDRIFYMALPPSVFIQVANQLHAHCKALNGGLTRLIVEKPFGKDLDSSRELGRALAAKWHEHELYRIDHYLGKEMVKNMISLRFANMFFGAVWDRNAISSVQITFKEMIGTEGRGGYFDEFGIVRDVMQNHLLQILTLVAMDRPVTLQADDVRNEKVKVLRCMKPIKLTDMVLGQYGPSLDGSKPGYLDDKTVPVGSKTPTYAAAVMFINNDRWAGVPFILRCGKALNEAKAEVRIQFRDVPGGEMFPSPLSRNELVIRVQPKEAVYLKLMNKEPGLSYKQQIAELDMTYHEKYEGVRIPDAYESLLLDVLRGDQANFVRDDELDAAWSLFTPALHEIDAGVVDPLVYPYGSRGPNGLIKFMAKYGVERDRTEYTWSPRSSLMVS